MVKLILKQKNIINDYGPHFEQYPLELAIRQSPELASDLIKLGAKVNARGPEGQTLLMRAVVRGEIKHVKFLLDAGADANLTDSAGITALAYAQCYSRPDADALLQAHGAHAAGLDACNAARAQSDKTDGKSKS